MSADEQENQSSHKGKSPFINRNPIEIIAKLEGEYALPMENERMLKENMLMEEVLRNKIYPICGGLPRRNQAEDEHILKQLQLENAYLKQEYERLSRIYASCKQKQSLAPMNRCVGSSSRSPTTWDENMLHQRVNINNRTQMEKAIMLKAGLDAKEEVLYLLSSNEPLWVKSQGDARLILHDRYYYKFFPRVDHFNGANARVESSKDSRIVRINAPMLVNMLLDSNKWYNLFPTIVTKAKTIKVLEMGSSEDRSGALLLMYGKMHVLSPLLPSREYYFLRYCEKIGTMWVIADASYDYLKKEGPHSSTWKFPSGCMIHQLTNASCKVSWVEHVEVEEKIQTHYLYSYVVNSTIAFGAQRWLMELQRMAERVTSGSKYIPVYDRGVVTSPQGRRSVMGLSHRIVKTFCRSLTMSSKINLLQHRIEDDNNGIRISIEKSEDPLSKDMNIVTVSSSFLLLFTTSTLLNFFKDPTKRFQWDVFCGGKPCIEVAHISTGIHPYNHISIIQPMEPLPQNGVVIMQESFIDSLGSYMVYSPVNIQELKATINGHDSSTVLILPSGIVISEVSGSLSNAQTSSNSSRNGRSLLTVTLQIFMAGPIPRSHESVTSVNSLITSTVENIKNALLNSSNFV